MILLELETFRLLGVFNRRYTLSEFRASANVVAGTYADEFVERAYNCLFKYPKDLRKEYEKYYAVEYPDFAQFLYWKYGVKKDVARKITDGTGDVFVGYGRDTIGVFTNEIGASVLKEILSKLGEEENENTK